jgi:hypothetical protein
MKTRNKVLLVIALAALSVWVSNTVNKHAYAGRCEGLKVWYDGFNNDYFLDTLPKDVVIDYSEPGDSIATTLKEENGRFHIRFSEKYAASPKVAHLYLLHEQCHVKTWDEEESHGVQWRTCMLQLDMEGAFRRQLIDSFMKNEN